MSKIKDYKQLIIISILKWCKICLLSSFLSFFLLPLSVTIGIIWAVKQTGNWSADMLYAVHVVHRRVRWFTVAVCPWWLTCCRVSLRRPTPSRRACWSCWTGSLSTAVLQRRKSLTLLQVRVCVYIICVYASGFGCHALCYLSSSNTEHIWVTHWVKIELT